VRDLGEALGTGATLTALRRTRSGRFGLADAVPLDGDLKAAARDRLVSPAAAIDHLPAWPISDAEAMRVAQGQRLPLPADATPGKVWRLLRDSGSLAAIAEAKPDASGILKMSYLRVMVTG
jgi:tRNA pseudouridine55 synthase